MRPIQSTHKGWAAITTLLLVGLLITTKTPAAAAAVPGTARISFAQGSVAVQDNKGLWQSAGQGWILLPGRWLKTGPEGRCEIILGRETVIRLDSGALLRIEKPRHSAGQKKAHWRLRLEDGAYWLNACGGRTGTSAIVRVVAAKGQFIAEGKMAGIKVSKGVPRFHVYAKDPAGSTRMQASAELRQPHVVTMEEWVEIVRSFRRYDGGGGGSTGLSEADRASLRNDPWFRWNLNRDRSLALVCP